MRLNVTVKVFVPLFVTIFVMSLTFVTYGQPRPNLAQLNPDEVVSSVNMTRVKEHLSFFVNLGSRITGSQGCALAADYIARTFENYGLANVSFHRFNVTVLMDYGASIYLPDYTNLSLAIYGLEPNLVSPVTTLGIVAPVVYVEGSPIAEFDGKTINGSVVLMEFNTGTCWLEAAKFGAKAVIFIEPERTTEEEISSKSVSLPFNFPRYYMPRESAAQLLSLVISAPKPPIARISSRSVWELATGINVLGVIPGAQPGKVIMLTSYYDSYSVVPLMNPGANDACGIATLLELAHYFSQHKPVFTILFVAFSGHYQSLSGSRWLGNDYFNQNSENRTKVLLMINIQTNTESDMLATACISGFRTEHSGSGFAYTSYLPFEDFIDSLINTLNSQLGPKYRLMKTCGGSRVAISPFGMMSDDVDGIAGASFSLTTPSYNTYLCSPIDTIDRLNLDNLKIQLEAILYSIASVVSTETLEIEYLKSLTTSAGYHLWNCPFIISGRVAFWNSTLGWYQNVPNSLIVLRKSWIETGTWGDKTPVIVKTDENGYFLTPGLNVGGGAGAVGRVLGWRSFDIYAFKLNDTTGNLIYAPDLGTHIYCPSSINTMGYDLDIGYYTVFECATVILLDIADPAVLGNAAVSFSFSIYDFDTASSPESHGFIVRADRQRAYTLAALFVPYDMRLSLVINTATLGRMPLAFLANATKERPDGSGFMFQAGSQQIFTPLDMVMNMYYSGKTTLSELGRYGIIDPSLTERTAQADVLVEKANAALNAKQYSVFNSYIIDAWGQTHSFYSGAKNTVLDIVNTVSFFGTFLVPFAILTEAFFFGFQGLKKLVAIVATFTAFFFYLYLFHPGFSMSSNIIMVIVGFLVLILTAPVIGILGGIFRSAISKWALKIRGAHFAGISLGSAVVLSVNLGIENLKKRKLRTVLVFITVMITVMCSTMFLSVTGMTVIRPGIWPKLPLYEGIYIRQDSWTSSLGAKTVDGLIQRYADQALILPRSNLYTVYPNDNARQVLFSMGYGTKSLSFYAILGLTAEYSQLPEVQTSLIEGRWFLPTDVYAVIISNGMAKDIGIEKVPVEVKLLEGKYTVIGILDSDIFDRIQDLDQEQITPFDESVPQQNVCHVSTKDCVILPYSTTLLYPETRVVAVSMMFKKPDTILDVASSIYSVASQLQVYAGEGNVTYIYTYVIRTSVIGWQTQIVPFAISCLMILNIMIGSVKERSREIFTYSSVGLSPLQVSLLFLAESLIYAIVAGLLGYALALGLQGLINALYPSFVPVNFASSWVITTLGIAMASTVLSTLYPMYISSRIVTPSLERHWRVPTKPGTDDWDIPLPFKTETQEEVLGMCVFLTEVLKTHRTARAEAFSLQDLSYREDLKAERPAITINMSVRLAPYEQGVTQNVQIIFVWNESTKRWNVSTYIKKTGGARSVWLKMVRGFIDEIRKQLLIWRAITAKERQDYISRVKELDEIRKGTL